MEALYKIADAAANADAAATAIANAGVDWQSRVGDWTDLMQSQYGIGCTQAKIILLPFIAPAVGNPVWVTMEGRLGAMMADLDSYLAFDEVSSWQMKPVSNMFPWVNRLIRERKIPRLFLDDEEYHMTRNGNRRLKWAKFESECLRVRIDDSSGNWGQANSNYNRVIARVLEPRGFSPVCWHPNKQFSNYVSILGKLLPHLTLSSVDYNLRLAISTHAVLCGRKKVTESDHLIALHLMQSMLKWWRQKMLIGLCNSYMSLNDLIQFTGANKRDILEELIGLSKSGIVNCLMDRDLLEELRKITNVKRPGNLMRKQGFGICDEWLPDVKALVDGSARWW